MKLNLWPPALIIQTDNPSISTTQGFVVKLMKNAPAHMVAHELWHVRQFWFLIGVGVAIAYGAHAATGYGAVLTPIAALPALVFEFVTELDRRKEMAAYAESVRQGRGLYGAALVASKYYNLPTKARSEIKARREIEKRLPRRWWGGYALF